MENERFSRPPDEIAGLSLARDHVQAASRVEVQDAVVVIGVGRRDEREPVCPREYDGEEGEGAEQKDAAAGRCHGALPGFAAGRTSLSVSTRNRLRFANSTRYEVSRRKKRAVFPLSLSSTTQGNHMSPPSGWPV